MVPTIHLSLHLFSLLLEFLLTFIYGLYMKDHVVGLINLYTCLFTQPRLLVLSNKQSVVLTKWTQHSLITENK